MTLGEARWRDLMTRAQRGDSGSYAILLKELAPPLRGFVRKRLRDDATSEDVVQEILISVHKSISTYDPTQPFSPWLFSLARYRLIDEFRRSGRRHAREIFAIEGVDFADSAMEDALSLLERQDENPELTHALARIPPRQREAVLLLKSEDLSVKEAAARMQVSEGSLKVLAHRGYTALRTRLTKGS